MSAAAEATEQLVTILARLQQIDLWPPTDAAETIIEAVRTAYEVAEVPPGPEPDQLADCAAAWHVMGPRWTQAVADVRTSRDRTAADGVWVGEAGDAFRASMTEVARRFASVPHATGAIESALTVCASTTRAARRRHAAAQASLHRHLRITWSDLLPWELVDHLRRALESILDALRELIGAYRDAATALEACGAATATALDGIELPSVLVAGVSAVEQVSLMSAGAGDDTGPLRGSTARRAQEALDAMSAADRARAQELLDAAPDGLARGWILAALASGLTGDALTRYAARLALLSEEQLRDLDPTSHDGVFAQPDGTTCGSSSLVMARMLNDPAFAMAIITGYDPRTDATSTPTSLEPDPRPGLHIPPSDIPIAARFQGAARAMHDQTSSLTSHDGSFNGWWPEALGTSPGAAARQMGGGAGLSGVPGSSYEVAYVDAADRAATFDRIVAAVDDGHAVPVYTYDVQSSGGSSGAHVTLVTGSRGDDLLVYDPWEARTVVVTRDEFTTASLGGDLGWDKPMATVLPR